MYDGYTNSTHSEQKSRERTLARFFCSSNNNAVHLHHLAVLCSMVSVHKPTKCKLPNFESTTTFSPHHSYVKAKLVHSLRMQYSIVSRLLIASQLSRSNPQRSKTKFRKSTRTEMVLNLIYLINIDTVVLG